jgi:hypothetical protein
LPGWNKRHRRPVTFHVFARTGVALYKRDSIRGADFGCSGKYQSSEPEPNERKPSRT